MKNIIFSVFLLLFVDCGNKNEQKSADTGNVEAAAGSANTATGKIASDTDMAAYLEENKSDFATLAGWMIEDKLRHIPLMKAEVETGKKPNISDERLAAYNELIAKHKIERIVLPATVKFNSVIFYMTEAGQGDIIVNKGYEYRRNPEIKYEEWVETNADLLTEAKKHELNTFVVKPIKQNWNLLILIQ